MSHLGFVPGRRSSGDKSVCGAITKAVNARARKALVSTAWKYTRRARTSQAPRKGQENVTADLGPPRCRGYATFPGVALAEPSGVGQKHTEFHVSSRQLWTPELRSLIVLNERNRYEGHDPHDRTQLRRTTNPRERQCDITLLWIPRVAASYPHGVQVAKPSSTENRSAICTDGDVTIRTGGGHRPLPRWTS